MQPRLGRLLPQLAGPPPRLLRLVQTSIHAAQASLHGLPVVPGGLALHHVDPRHRLARPACLGEPGVQLLPRLSDQRDTPAHLVVAGCLGDGDGLGARSDLRPHRLPARGMDPSVHLAGAEGAHGAEVAERPVLARVEAQFHAATGRPERLEGDQPVPILLPAVQARGGDVDLIGHEQHGVHPLDPRRALAHLSPDGNREGRVAPRRPVEERGPSGVLNLVQRVEEQAMRPPVVSQRAGGFGQPGAWPPLAADRELNVARVALQGRGRFDHADFAMASRRRATAMSRYSALASM